MLSACACVLFLSGTSSFSRDMGEQTGRVRVTPSDKSTEKNDN